MEVVHDVHAVWRGEVAVSGRDQELHAHDRHTRESDRDREFRPEAAATRRGPINKMNNGASVNSK